MSQNLNQTEKFIGDQLKYEYIIELLATYTFTTEKSLTIKDTMEQNFKINLYTKRGQNRPAGQEITLIKLLNKTAGDERVTVTGE